MMSKQQLMKDELEQKLKEFTELLDNIITQNLWSEVSSETMQQITEAILLGYAYKNQTEMTNRHNSFLPIPEDTTLTDTDVFIMIDKLLEARNLDVFEIQMYRSFCRTYY